MPTFYILYLVDEDIVVFTSIEVLIYVLVKVLVIHDAIKLSFDNITDAKYMINNGYQMLGFTAMGGVKVRF